jgi:cytochrome P450
MVIVFPFDGDRMLGERLYFDLATPLRQLGVARDPSTTAGRVATALNHPVTVGRALLRVRASSSRSNLPPGSMGLPVIGETPAFLRSPYRFLERRQRRYGDVFRSGVLLRRVVFLTGLEGAEAFYDDRNISRRDAHPFPLVDLFGGDNMEMLDGTRHARLKTAALEAFAGRALDRYVGEVRPLVDACLRRLATDGERAALEPLQRLAIECIWTNVLGPTEPREAAAIAKAYGDIVAGLTSPPVPIPGTPYGRARAARDRLLDRIARAVTDRRAAPTGDGLSRMLEASPTMTDREAQLEVHHFVIAGFIVYLLMAEVLRRLAEHPALLQRCRDEIEAQVGAGPATFDALSRLPVCTNVVREAKRIVPLVPLAFGRARRSFRCGEVGVPAGWTVYLALHLSNHDARLFREPERFDPDRFATGRAEHEHHPLAFIPQGADPPTGHQCLGLRYSTVLVLTFMTELVRGYTWSLPPQDLDPDPRRIPPVPKDGLRVRLEPRTDPNGVAAGRG